MTIITDTRGQSTSGTTSRQRVLDRHKKLIREAVRKVVTNGNIPEIGKDGLDITIPKRDLSQPRITHGPGGKRAYVHPGNKEYQQGDRIERPPSGGGGAGSGQKAGDGDDGEDDFTIHLNEEEFLNVIYEDLGLPNLNIFSAADTTKTQLKYSGLVSQGPPEKLHLVRSKREQLGRVIASSEDDNEIILKLLREEKAIFARYDQREKPSAPVMSGLAKAWYSTEEQIEKIEKAIKSLKKLFGPEISEDDKTRIDGLEKEIKARRDALAQIPEFDEVDLKYRSHTPQAMPCAKAVMFCLMDVSGSMTEERKYKAQLFYFLLYRFLQRNHDKVDIVYVRHTTTANEVDHNEFFHGNKTGGTIVSSGLQLTSDIQAARYPENEWNIYLAQASDGDNGYGDDEKCDGLMRAFLKKAQFAFYTEITEGEPQSLWETYEKIREDFPNKFSMAQIIERSDIVRVFRQFFSKGSSTAAQSRLAAAVPNGP